MAATPLSQVDADELEASGLGDLVVKIGGSLYNSEDCFACSACDTHVVSVVELDGRGECEDCAELSLEEDEDLQELMADFRASRL